MSVPARKKSSSSVRRRRSHHGMKAQNVSMCQECQAPLLPHRACKNCGSYKGKQVLNTQKETVRAVKKAVASAPATQKAAKTKTTAKETKKKTS